MVPTQTAVDRPAGPEGARRVEPTSEAATQVCMPDGLPAPVRLILVTDLVFVRVARKMLEGLLNAQGWEEETVEEVALVATELVQNAIEHGSRNDGTETAELWMRLDPGAVVLEMTDPGTGKDPSILLDRDETGKTTACHIAFAHLCANCLRGDQHNIHKRRRLDEAKSDIIA